MSSNRNSDQSNTLPHIGENDKWLLTNNWQSSLCSLLKNPNDIHNTTVQSHQTERWGKKVQKNMQVFINSTETYMRTTTIHPNNSRKGSQNSCSCNISMQIKSTCSNKQSNLL